MTVRFVPALVDDVPEVVEAAGVRGTPGCKPGLPTLPAFPAARREAEDFGLDATPFQRPCKNVGADGGDRDWPTAHRSRIVDQQRDYRVAEFGVALDLVAERMAGADHDTGQPRRVEQSLLLVEVPASC